jgi:hypothetical protein
MSIESNFIKGLSKILGISEVGNSLDEVDVSSSAIDTITYDNYTKVLTVRFAESGSEYSYALVSDEEANAFINAASIGKFFNREIKGSHIFWKIS